MKLARVTETGEAPAWQGVTTENIGHIRPRNNADRRDAPSVECRGVSPRAPRWWVVAVRASVQPSLGVS